MSQRVAPLGAVFMVGILAVACGPSPTTPSASTAMTGTPTASVTTGGTARTGSVFGASVADLARCLSGSPDAECFSGIRLLSTVGVTTRALGTAPSAPSNLTSSVSGGTVTLSWGAPASGDSVSTYVLEAGSSSGLANLANAAVGTSTTYVATGVGAGTYYVRVRAQNAGGTSGASNEVVVVVGSTVCASAPSAPGALSGSASGSTVSLAWSTPSGGCAPTSYVLQAGASSGASNLANSSTGSTATSYVATGVGAGTYYVRVLAQNAFGQSTASNEVVVTVGGTSTPTGLVITGWSGQLTIGPLGSGGGYLTTGQIQMTTNIGVTGLLRAKYENSGPFPIQGQQRFIGSQRNLTFQVFVITFAGYTCPDLHGTKTLSLYDDDHGGVLLGSIQATSHGSGCAFDPLEAK